MTVPRFYGGCHNKFIQKPAVYFGSPGGELSAQRTEGWLPTQGLKIIRIYVRLPLGQVHPALPHKFTAIPHNSKCRYGERGAADAKPKAQIILDAAKVSAASGGNSEPKQGQRSQSARGFCPRSTMRVPQPDIIEHFGNADAVPQLPERCLSRKAGIVRCCLTIHPKFQTYPHLQFLISHS